MKDSSIINTPGSYRTPMYKTRTVTERQRLEEIGTDMSVDLLDRIHAWAELYSLEESDRKTGCVEQIKMLCECPEVH